MGLKPRPSAQARTQLPERGQLVRDREGRKLGVVLGASRRGAYFQFYDLRERVPTRCWNSTAKVREGEVFITGRNLVPRERWVNDVRTRFPRADHVLQEADRCDSRTRHGSLVEGAQVRAPDGLVIGTVLACGPDAFVYYSHFATDEVLCSYEAVRVWRGEVRFR